MGLAGSCPWHPDPSPAVLQDGEAGGLVAIGALGLCFLLDPTKHLGSSTVPSPTTAPSAPSLPPAPSLPTAAPCVANSSVHNISGFEELPQHVKDFMRYRHCRSFRQLLDVPGKCGGPQGSSSISLLLAIKSSPANYERREVIRRTWGQQRTFEGAHIRRVFLVGVSPQAHDARKLGWLLHLEQREHRDVLQWDFSDTFFNLTLKQVLFHAWLEEHCPGVHFIFNGDDDVFVNTDNVVRFMKTSRGSQHLMVGSVLINTGPIRDKGSKYYVPKQLMPSERYPPYCSGGGMLMSGYTARIIHRASQSIDLLPIDDAYLGMCLEQAGLSPASHSGVRLCIYAPRNSDPSTPCYYRELLVVHRFVSFETAAMWQAIHEPQLSCGRKVSIF
ncbi:LOW QUALITY PROTEIN: acetylgalactosaminyl-O-glycosyl-glycoprotein beta-1,3-N-acetylglucosaminyltransferase-like [Mergus octosetaceus]